MAVRSRTANKLAKGILPTEREMLALRAKSEALSNLIDVADTLARNKLSSSESDAAMTASAGAAGAAIVVGHTKAASGASGVSPINQSEYPWNKDLAERVKTICTAGGQRCEIFYRDNGGIAGAYGRVEKWGATCVVELHFNASNGKAAGTETLYDADVNAGSKAWAQRLQTGMVDLYGRKGKTDRGLKELDLGDRGYESCSALNIPSALIEPFFGDNPDDARLGNEKKQDLAGILAAAIKAQLES